MRVCNNENILFIQEHQNQLVPMSNWRLRFHSLINHAANFVVNTESEFWVTLFVIFTWRVGSTHAPALEVDEQLLGDLEAVERPPVVGGRGAVIALGQGVGLQPHQVQEVGARLGRASGHQEEDIQHIHLLHFVIDICI